MDMSSVPRSVPGPDGEELKIVPGDAELGRNVGIFESQPLSQGPEKTETEGLPQDAFALDPANPINWSKKQKWTVVATVSCMMLLK